MNVVIANIIDFLASLVQIYTGAVKEKSKILVLQILQLGMQTVSMVLLGAIPGAISNVLSCIRNYLCYTKFIYRCGISRVRCFYIF